MVLLEGHNSFLPVQLFLLFAWLQCVRRFSLCYADATESAAGMWHMRYVSS